MTELNGPRTGPAAGGAPRQLIVLCHGLGADGHDLIDIAAAWRHAVPQAAFAAPDAPFPCDLAPPSEMEHGGRQWFSVSDRTPAAMELGVRAAAGFLDAFIDAELTRLSLGPDAYALMGFSQGAMTVLFTGLRRAVPPRAILAYSGALIAAETIPPGRRDIPVLLVHGEDDEVVLVSRSRDAEAALRAAGFPVESLYCPRLGHGIDQAGLSIGALFLQRAFSPIPDAGT